MHAYKMSFICTHGNVQECQLHVRVYVRVCDCVSRAVIARISALEPARFALFSNVQLHAG